MPDDTMEMEIQRKIQPAGNLSKSVFESTVFDSQKTVSGAPTVFDRQTAIDTGGRQKQPE